MFGSILGGMTYIDPELLEPSHPLYNVLSRHELGQHDDYVAGLMPMAKTPEPVRVPPPFPLAAYLVMKRAE